MLNLDAELELADPRYQPRTRLLDQLAKYGTDSRMLLGSEDILLTPGREVAEPFGFTGRAWCPTGNALRILADSGVVPEPHPDTSVIRRVNHRRFAHELGGGLSGQRFITDLSELEEWLRRADHPLLLKRPLAFAGRGQQRVYSFSRITQKEWSWIQGSLAKDGLVVEPLVKISCEFSLHGFVWPDKEFELGRICVQEVSDRGVFRRLRLAKAGELRPSEETALWDRAALTASALGTAAYFGPFGIDAYRYELGGQVGFCEQGEINARYTMGFVTGFTRHPGAISLSRV